MLSHPLSRPEKFGRRELSNPGHPTNPHNFTTMHRHAFRSVCSRTRPELEQASDALQSCIRQFSTTQLQAAADDNGPAGNSNNSTPSLRERSRTATNEINSLARARSPMRGGKSPSGPVGGPRVIDIKSLPRMAFRGRGGVRGGLTRGRGGFVPRGGAVGAGPSRFAGASRGPRGRGGFGARGGGRGGFTGRGGRGGGGARQGKKARGAAATTTSPAMTAATSSRAWTRKSRRWTT